MCLIFQAIWHHIAQPTMMRLAFTMVYTCLIAKAASGLHTTMALQMAILII
jgi:hypothetical protein